MVDAIFKLFGDYFCCRCLPSWRCSVADVACAPFRKSPYFRTTNQRLQLTECVNNGNDFVFFFSFLSVSSHWCIHLPLSFHSLSSFVFFLTCTKQRFFSFVYYPHFIQLLVNRIAPHRIVSIYEYIWQLLSCGLTGYFLLLLMSFAKANRPFVYFVDCQKKKKWNGMKWSCSQHRLANVESHIQICLCCMVINRRSFYFCGRLVAFFSSIVLVATDINYV